MNTVYFVGFTVLIWVISLLQGTGIGEMINITEKAHILLLFVVGIIILFTFNKIRFKKKNFLLASFIFMSFIFIPYIRFRATTGVSYLYVFLLIFILSNIQIREKYIKITALAYAGLGIVFLCFYNFTNLLSGWNTNSIAMIGFFSYTVFYIGFMNEKKGTNKIFVLLIAGMYLFLLEIANSRSSTLFILISIIFIFKRVNTSLLQKKSSSLIFLIAPLIIAVGVICVSKSSLFHDLERWSYETFNKPVFNGRDKIWENGFQVLKNNILFGQGTIENGWHNSAITCLAAFGIVGYSSWIITLNRIIAKGRFYLKDNYIKAALISFFLTYIQQAVELGFIATNPDFIPYVILGILMGRIKYLKGCEEIETIS